MSRHATVILAILVLANSGLSASAFTRGGGYDAGGGAIGSRGNNFGDGFHGDGHDGYGNRASDFRGEFRDHKGRDVWGHWGAYYGPMIPMI
jgi:hypothetical protein